MDRVLNPRPHIQKPGLQNAARLPGRPKARAQAAPPPPLAPSRPPGTVHTLGVYCLCLYLFSAYANDLSLHFLGGKAYLSWVSGILLVVAFLACGTPVRGLQSKIGKAWLALLLFQLLSSAFSIWRSASAGLLEAYVFRSLCLFFFACAFTLTLRQCRILILGNVVCTTAILLTVALFGGAVGGRFAVPDSFLFGGGNDLALALVCSLGFTLFLVMQKSVFAQVAGAGEFLLTLYFLLKTGSRGGFVALGAVLIVWMLFSGKRMKLVVLLVPAIAIIPLLPGSTLNRLIEIAAPATLNAENATDEATESQLERTMLLQRSIQFALTHPVFGVGLGEFSDALFESDVANRTHTHALGTHNTYTQVASECGIPALVFYLMVLFGSIASNFRILKRTRSLPGAELVFSMSLCLLISVVAFAVNTIFHHDAYSQTLPILSGMSAALALASRNGDPRWIEAEIAAGNA